MAGKTRKDISVKGGGIVQYREIDPTPNSTWTDLGWIEESQLQDIFNMILIKDDAGRVVDYKEAGEEFIFKTKLLQSSKANIDFQATAATRIFDIYIPILLNNGKTQEFSAPCCRLKAGVDLSMKPGTRTIDIEIHAVAPVAAFTRTPVDYNVVQFQPYVLIENAVAKGAPSDTATNLAAAVV